MLPFCVRTILQFALDQSCPASSWFGQYSAKIYHQQGVVPKQAVSVGDERVGESVSVMEDDSVGESVSAAVVEESPICPSCGAPVESRFKFCPKCGEHLQAA